MSKLDNSDVWRLLGHMTLQLGQRILDVVQAQDGMCKYSNVAS